MQTIELRNGRKFELTANGLFKTIQDAADFSADLHKSLGIVATPFTTAEKAKWEEAGMRREDFHHFGGPRL